MKKIAVGFRDSRWEKQLECSGCGTIWIIGRDDLFVETTRSFGDNLCSVTVECQECHYKFVLKEFKVKVLSYKDINKSNPFGEIPFAKSLTEKLDAIKENRGGVIIED